MATRFHSLLEVKIQEAMQEMSASVCRGQATDYARYKESCGYIHGLETALRLCDEVEQDMGNERSNAV